MNDCVYRQAAIDELDKGAWGVEWDKALAKAMIESLPSAQPERKKGKWERRYSRPNVYADLCWHCSVCEFKTSDNWANKWNFCPNCGADMKGESNG